MKFLLEFKKYAPVLFTFLFLAAVFASCFFDTRKQDKAEKESLRYLVRGQLQVTFSSHISKLGK